MFGRLSLMAFWTNLSYIAPLYSYNLSCKLYDRHKLLENESSYICQSDSTVSKLVNNILYNVILKFHLNYMHKKQLHV